MEVLNLWQLCRMKNSLLLFRDCVDSVCVLWYYSSGQHMSAPISRDTQYSGSTASKIFSHIHTCSVSPSCLTLQTGSCVPLGVSPVIHLFKALWFMSAFRSKEKCTQVHLRGLNVASCSQLFLKHFFLHCWWWFSNRCSLPLTELRNDDQAHCR